MTRTLGLAGLVAALSIRPGGAAEDASAMRAEALGAMKRATAFFTSKVATRGGYLWKYSLDFTKREGEGKATPTQIWVQPPGTPSVGQAFLRAYEATKDKAYLDAAVAAGQALAWGQLASGGWDYRIDFDPKASQKWYYRRDVEAGDATQGKRRNVTTFDDDNSQSALRLLMCVDQAVGGKVPEIRKAVAFGLKAFLEAQYPNGAWPQRRSGPYDPAKCPVIKARYPETWSRKYEGIAYQSYYTWNDNAIRDCVRTLLMAYDFHKRDEYRAAAIKAGDFAILSQMPEPQPAWAQQYNLEMEPAWARKFEPPSVTAGESKAALDVLRMIYKVTGEAKYLEPMPRAFAWYKRSKLPDGTWARFYELKTNKPLYFTRDTYKLTYDDGDMPTHYGFKGPGMYPTDIEAWYDRVMKLPPDQRAASVRDKPGKAKPGKVSTKAVRKIIDGLDDQGRWVKGEWIECSTFIRNLQTLAAFVEATQP
ncbi:MAG: pectic acid lyase [Phycisphaerae bacterium]|nr:pectic acid lyase [Phycisphaerae bacterium]